jgi:GT2 family glycosyltransferase
MKVAVLITCFNRKDKTLKCLEALFGQEGLNNDFTLEVFLVDDGSTDGTAALIHKNFPEVNLIEGSGSLFWAGGMRRAWKEALKGNYEAYLLLNDDTILFPVALLELLETDIYCSITYKKRGIYIGSTLETGTSEFSYGGYTLKKSWLNNLSSVLPSGITPQPCKCANANIMWVSDEVVAQIGIISDRFTHSLADFDYTLSASKNKIPLLVCANYCGTCSNDHKKPWLTSNYSLQERIKYLNNPKFLAYKEYLYYIRKHFPLILPLSFIKLWLKTLCPSLWNTFKR